MQPKKIWAIGLVINLVWVSLVAAADPTIGVSYAQATRYMTDHFQMEKTSPVNGMDRYLGNSQDGLATLEIVGKKSNISGATLLLAMAPGDEETMMANIPWIIRLLKNTVPDWPGTYEWVSEQLGKLMAKFIVTGTPDTTHIIKGNHRITVAYMGPGIACVSVKHKAWQ